MKPVSNSARELSAKLLPHTTSVHNVTLLTEALTAARQQALEDAAKIVEDYDHPCCEGGNLYADEIRAMKVQP